MRSLKVDTGKLVRGAAAFDCLCKHIPLYLPMRPLLRIPPIWRRVEQTMAGLGERARERRRQITRRWR